MALVPCPDCGRSVSDIAATCIGCGRPMAVGEKFFATTAPVVRTQAKGAQMIAAGAGLSILGVIVVFLVPALGGVLMLVGFGVFVAGRLQS